MEEEAHGEERQLNVKKKIALSLGSKRKSVGGAQPIYARHYERRDRRSSRACPLLRKSSAKRRPSSGQKMVKRFFRDGESDYLRSFNGRWQRGWSPEKPFASRFCRKSRTGDDKASSQKIRGLSSGIIRTENPDEGLERDNQRGI